MRKEPFHGRADHWDFEGTRSRGKAEELCRRHWISGTTFYKWKSKFGGLEVSEARRLRALEARTAG